MKSAGAVEELEMEGDSRLTVYFSIWGGLHCHLDGGVNRPGSNATAVDYRGSIIAW